MKTRYREGDWFAVPLRQGGYGVGIVARANPDGVLLGYFFGPKREHVPQLDDLSVLRPEDAVLIAKFGDLSLLRDTRGATAWPVLGQGEPWSRSRWPLPVFGRHEELTGRSFAVHYSERDLVIPLKEDRISAAACQLLASADLYGSGAVEIALTARLDPSSGEGR